MKHIVRAALLALPLLSVIPHRAHAQIPPVRERLGGRLGYVETYGKTYEHYGAGWNANLYFTERMYQALFLDIKLGGIYLGDLLKPDVARNIVGADVESEMRVLFLSVGPQLTFGLGGTRTGYMGVALGVYSASVVFANAIQSYDFSDQHVGGNASIGLLWRFTSSWNLDLNLTLHHFRTAASFQDLFFAFTGDGAEDPYLLQAALGITIDMH
jgi:hypothetical protein